MRGLLVLALVLAGCGAAPPPPAAAPAPEPAPALAPPPLALLEEPSAPPALVTMGEPKEPAIPLTYIPAGKSALTVVCSPACDRVVDNGTPLPTPVEKAIVPAGRHVITVVSGATKKEIRVELDSDMIKIVHVSVSADTPHTQTPCSMPYWFDGEGHKHYKPDCLGGGASTTPAKMPTVKH